MSHQPGAAADGAAPADPVEPAVAEAQARALSDAGELPAASTVLLLRDVPAGGPDAPGDGPAGGVEVCVIERKKAGAFAGLLAFPGGKVDEADRTLPGHRWRGTAFHEGHAPMSDRDLGWQVAAVREAFEEVGVLLAHRGDGAPVTAADLVTESFLDARARLTARGEPWDWTDWLVAEDLVLDLASLGTWSWWITPPQEPRRFDTRFYVAAVPAEQADALSHDEVETDSARWLTADAIMAEHAEGRATVIYPTRRNLELLAPYASAAEAMAAARGGHLDLRPVMPTLFERDGEFVAAHPYDGTVEPVL